MFAALVFIAMVKLFLCKTCSDFIWSFPYDQIVILIVFTKKQTRLEVRYHYFYMCILFKV